jgi:hypothetical protein
MPDGRRRRGPQLPQLAAALVVAVALWLVSRGRERVRAAVPVDVSAPASDAAPGGARTGAAFAPGTVEAVVEGPAASVLTLHVRPPWLRAGAAGRAGVPVLGPGDVELPDGLGDVMVREVVVRLPAP